MPQPFFTLRLIESADTELDMAIRSASHDVSHWEGKQESRVVFAEFCQVSTFCF